MTTKKTPTKPQPPAKKLPPPVKVYTPNEEQLSSPWLRQPWDTNTNWTIFSLYLTMNQRNVSAAYRLYASQNNKAPNTTGNVLNSSRGQHANNSSRLTMIDSRGQVVPIPTWPERAVAYDNNLAKKLMEDVQARQLMYSAKAYAHLHNNTMALLDNLTKSIKAYKPQKERIGELVSAHAKASEIIGQLYQTHVPDGETGKVVSPEKQTATALEKIGRLAEILTVAKERVDSASGEEE